jgi:tetratricopeptide (TPR) repeat protein
MKKHICICLLLMGIFSTTLSSYGQEIKITPETGGSAERPDTEETETEQARRAKTDEQFFEALKAKQHDDIEQAEALLKQFIANRPESAAAYYELSRIYTDQKKSGLATASIKKAMAIDPANKWYKESYATVLAVAGSYAEAANVYAELTKQEAKDEEYPVQAAEYYERAGKQQEALNYLDIALQRTLEDEDLMVHKMQLHLNMNNVQKAADVVQEMIAKDPKNGKYYKLLGELYDNNKMTDKASAVYEQAQKKLPNDPAVQLGLAGHYLRTGDSAQYKIYVRKAITNKDIETEAQLELLKAYIQSMPDEATAIAEALPLVSLLATQEPADAQILAYYGEVLEGSNKKDSAAVMYKKSLALKPSDFNVWGRLMVSYLDKPYADSLIKYSEKAMRLFPNQSITHFYNGIGYMNKNNNTAAIKAIKRAIDLQPETEKEALAQMYSTLGDIYYTNKQHQLSDETFDKALALDPNNAGVLNNYSYYLSERGVKLDEAERMSKKSLELRPNEPNSLDTYGWILYKKGEYEKAKTYILKAITESKGEGEATPYNHLGDILFKLNEKDKAIEAWKKAKQKGSDDKNLDKKISEGKLYE